METGRSMKIALSNAYIFIAKKKKTHLVEFKMAFTFFPLFLEDMDKGQMTSSTVLAVALLHLNALIWSTTI